VVLGCHASSCGDDAPAAGTALVDVGLPAAVTDAQVTYQISSAQDGVVSHDTFFVHAPGVTRAIFVRLRALGGGYGAVVSAVSRDGRIQCAGQQAFAVDAGKTTVVGVTMRCRVPITDGTPAPGGVTFVNCPTITSYALAPLRTGPSGQIAVNATAVPGDPSRTVALRWSATSGRFANPDQSSTTYTCAPGAQTLSVGAWDGACGEAVVFHVGCGEAPLGK